MIVWESGCKMVSLVWKIPITERIIRIVNLTKDKMEHIFELLLQSAAEEKERILFADSEKGITYQDAVVEVSRIALFLKRRNIHNSPILVKAERNADTLIFFLGIAASDNYYVPVSETTPTERLNDIISIADIHYAIGFDKEGLVSLDMEEARKEEIVEAELDELKKACSIDHPLYLMFTSGSTGKPKGVIKSHGNVLAFVKNFKETFTDIEEHQRLANQTPFYFDASAKDIYLTIALRSTLYIPPKEVFVLPNRSIEYLNDKQITLIMWVPSALIMIARIRVLSFMKPQFLKYVFFIGEVFPSKYFNMWYKALPDVTFVNWYGSTETAGACLYHIMERPLLDDESAPIGKPLKNNTVKLEDGEICIRSEQVALGYLNEPEKNRQTFVREEDGIYLHTGDYGQYNEDGDIVFRTRKDFQIKHMGYRIELQDIEKTVLSIDYIASCCAVYAKERICLIVTLTMEKTPSEIMQDLKPILADYMMPSRIVIKETMPLNANGKIDRVSLKKEMEA